MARRKRPKRYQPYIGFLYNGILVLLIIIGIFEYLMPLQMLVEGIQALILLTAFALITLYLLIGWGYKRDKKGRYRAKGVIIPKKVAKLTKLFVLLMLASMGLLLTTPLLESMIYALALQIALILKSLSIPLFAGALISLGVKIVYE